LVTAGAAGALWVRGDVPDVRGLRGLSAAEYRTFRNLVTATFPPGGPFPIDPGDDRIARAFDDYVADEPDEKATETGRALLLVELAPLVWDSRRTTFSRLSAEERENYWASWPTADRLLKRQVSLGFRKFMNMLFYDHPDIWPKIGYGGPSLKRLGQQ
jgi:hypothetical protein